MLSLSPIAGCRITELLREDAKIGIYRARQSDGGLVIIKALRAAYPAIEDIARLRHEWEIARLLQEPRPLAGAVRALELVNHQNGVALLIEDFGGIALSHFLQEKGALDLETFFVIALSLCATLEEIHARRIVHKDLKPSNVLINAQEKIVKIGDFGIASRLASENMAPDALPLMQGTFSYMSPEQTGRMNQPLDYRTDFYSLGVTFFEMLAGRLPFESSDTLEIVHSHLAKAPPVLHEIKPEIPPVLSRIIAKLLAKTARERYQSARGLRADLEECAAQWRAKKTIELFELARHDRSDELQISHQLYGRDGEVESLLAAFERASNGAREIVLIGGYSGIGKTSVVGEVQKPIVQKHAFFVAGKFDQFRRDVPYASLIGAFRDLIRQVLTESEARLSAFKTSLLEAFGPNGQVLIDVIPEIELIVGPQPPAAELGSVEAQNRFNFLMQNFVRVWAQAEHPLVLFVDDLQWADAASLRLLQSLMTEGETRHLLIIGAYRDNEVSPSHPLMLARDEILKSAAPLTQITLGPLALAHVAQLIADSLRGTREDVQPLAALLTQKTGGNPFFLNQLLQSLHQQKLLFCEDGAWRWDLVALRAANLTENVVELMAGKIQKLPPATQEILKLGACIGNRFDERTLRLVLEKNAEDDLWEATREGLIAPLGQGYYKFLHDRVQQAADSLMSDDERRADHLKIARLQWENYSSAEREENLFEIVNHWNEGRAAIQDADELHQLVRLNLQAGLKAKASAAHAAAIKHFAIGQELAPPDLWQSDYETMFRLARERSESEYVETHFEEAERQFELALSHAKDELSAAAIETIRVNLYTTRNDYEKAIGVGLNGLNALGLSLPSQPSQVAIVGALLKALRLQKGRAVSEIANLPRLREPRRLAQVELLSTITPAAYLAGNQNLFGLLVLNIVNISLQHGNSQWSAPGYSLYGVLLVTLGKTQKAVAIGEMAVRLASQFDDLASRCKTVFAWGCYLVHQRRPLREAFAPMEEAYRLGLESGDMIYGGYAIMNVIWQMALSGMALDELDANCEKYLLFLRDKGDGDQVLMSLFAQRTARNLQGRTADVLSLDGDGFIEAEVRAAIEQKKHAASTQCWYFLTKTRHFYIWREPAVALEMARETETLLGALMSTPYVPEHNFYYSLIIAALYSQASEEEQVVYKKQLRKNQKRMKKWASNAPANYEHKYLLVEAEKARIEGRDSLAGTLYDSAIRAAHEAEFIQNEALANELAARFYLASNRPKLARVYLDEARYLYGKWGANAKVDALLEEFPQLSPVRETKRKAMDVTHTTDSHTGEKTSALDLATVIKAAQAVSGEIDLRRLLQQLLRFALENAGATRGALLLLHDGQLFIEAQGAIGENEVSLTARPLEESEGEVPLSIIQYVARTRESVVLGDAAREGLFTGDAYVKARRPQSVLCAPIVHQTKLNGLIYLENHLAPGAFTPARLEVLNVLAAQGAISLQNAQLYQELEQRVEQRTEELRGKNEQLQQTLSALQEMQNRVIMQEKMASLGALTAGIAHEIKNPLNFVNNFASLSVGLVDELNEELEKFKATLNESDREYLDEILGDLKGNAQKINEHGRRADSIVRNMLLHSRGQSSAPEVTDINALAREAVQLAYHGQRAKDTSFNVTIEENYDASLPRIQVLPQEISRVVLNIANNACYAAHQKAHRLSNSFSPTLKIVTKKSANGVEIRIADNGDGIPKEVRENIFTPFFTTKPTGEGTGLGLSMSYDIIVQQHGGTIEVESQEGEGTEFIVTLPLK